MSITSSILNYLSTTAAFNNPMMTTGYIISFEPKLSTDDNLTEFFSTLFDVKKLAVISRKEKEVEKIALIVGSPQNAEMLADNNFGFKDSRCHCHQITPEKANELIIDNRTKVYVGAISYGVDNVQIWNHFAKFGSLEYSYVIRKPTKNGKKGFGFVTFKSRASLLKALSGNHYIKGKKLIVSEFSSKPANKKKVQLESAEKNSPECTSKSSRKEHRSSGIDRLDSLNTQTEYFNSSSKAANYGMHMIRDSPNYENFRKESSQLFLYHEEEQCKESQSWFESPEIALDRTMHWQPMTLTQGRRCLARRPTSDKIEAYGIESETNNLPSCHKKPTSNLSSSRNPRSGYNRGF